MMFTGTTQQQDTRFSDKEKKLMKQMKFGDCLNKRVDMSKVKLDVLRPWISKKITDILHIEDDVVVEFVYNQLEEEKYPCPKKMQINMTGFLNGRNARQFMGELWSLLLSAQDSESGIPAEFIHHKKDEILKRETKSSCEPYPLHVENYQHPKDVGYDRSKSETHPETKTQNEREKGISAAVEHLRTKLQVDLETASSAVKTKQYNTKETNVEGHSSFPLDLRSNIKHDSSDLVSSSSQKRSSGQVEEHNVSLQQEKNQKNSSEVQKKRFTGSEEIHSHKHTKSRSISPKQYSHCRYRASSQSQSPTSVNGKEDGKETNISNAYIDNRRRRGKSTSSHQSCASNSSSRIRKRDKATNQQKRSRMPKSPLRSFDNHRSNRKRSKSLSGESSSVSCSSYPDKKVLELRRTTKSIQMKRSYRNNRCSSVSSTDYDVKQHHRDVKHRQNSKQRWVGHRKDMSMESKVIGRHRRSSSKHCSRSPRVRSRSPRVRSRSPRVRSRSPRVRSRSPRMRSRSPRKSRSPHWSNRQRSPHSFRGGRGNNNNRTAYLQNRPRNHYDRRFSPHRRLPRESPANRPREHSPSRSSLQKRNVLHHQNKQRVPSSEQYKMSSNRIRERNAEDCPNDSLKCKEGHKTRIKKEDFIENQLHEPAYNRKKNYNAAECIKTVNSSDDSEIMHKSNDVTKKRNDCSSTSSKRIKHKNESTSNREAYDSEKNKVEIDDKMEQKNYQPNEHKSNSKIEIRRGRNVWDGSLSRTPSPFLKPHERSSETKSYNFATDTRSSSFAGAVQNEMQENENKSSIMNKEVNSIPQSKKFTDSKQIEPREAKNKIHISKRDKASSKDTSIQNDKNENVLLDTENENSNIRIRETITRNSSATISAKALEPRDLRDKDDKHNSKKKIKNTTDNESPINTDTDFHSKKPKYKKKHKKSVKKSKKLKKNKKKTKRMENSSSSENEGNEKSAHMTCKTVQNLETDLLYEDVNDDLERKLRERALKSMKRID